MIKLIIIAGPQSSGKTTAFNHLKSKFPDFHYREEINPYLLAGKNHLGGAFTTRELELKLVEADLLMLKNLNALKLNLYKAIILETSIFHLVYTEKFCGQKIANNFFEKYLLLQKKFNCLNIFIDTKPEVSFRRRYPTYLKRIKKQNGEINSFEFLKRYQKTIYDLYPLWLKWYDRVPFNKLTIRNSFKTKKEFLLEMEEKLLRF